MRTTLTFASGAGLCRCSGSPRSRAKLTSGQASVLGLRSFGARNPRSLYLGFRAPFSFFKIYCVIIIIESRFLNVGRRHLSSTPHEQSGAGLTRYLVCGIIECLKFFEKNHILGGNHG